MAAPCLLAFPSFARIRTSSQPLPPTLHALLSPVRVGVEVGEVRGRLEEAVLSLVALPSVAMRRELTTKAWELDQVGGSGGWATGVTAETEHA
jgi:hypothetical protein